VNCSVAWGRPCLERTQDVLLFADFVGSLKWRSRNDRRKEPHKHRSSVSGYLLLAGFQRKVMGSNAK